ncbi:uncharacterized protein LOC123560673 [Mercenaria mercenaria]|uniref:uncharacterized protein LOC123560673 n=1 Tax=Mercenaria mercenaria TaxID=6596 RepID=UPI00234EAE33|nr:uncharacterized protein LOC123560673 [Mercenaria mercenaria]
MNSQSLNERLESHVHTESHFENEQMTFDQALDFLESQEEAEEEADEYGSVRGDTREMNHGESRDCEEEFRDYSEITRGYRSNTEDSCKCSSVDNVLQEDFSTGGKCHICL